MHRCTAIGCTANTVKTLLAWSSGKDSAWTLHVLRLQGIAVGALLTTINQAVDRVAMHGVRASLLDAQADAAGISALENSVAVALYK